MDFALFSRMPSCTRRHAAPILALIMALGASFPALAAAPALTLRHVHQGTQLTVQLVDEKGQIRRQALAQLRAFLACHKTGVNHPIHWRLAAMLVGLSQHWPGKVIQVHSGYRHPKVSRHAKRSNHTRGRAIDIRIPGVPNRRLFDTLRRSYTQVGLGYYPNSAFVHLDVRQQSALWVDYAGPNHRACYSPTPYQDLSNGMADSLSEHKARARGCK